MRFFFPASAVVLLMAGACTAPAHFHYPEPAPTDSALVFMPGIVSTDSFEFSGVFSPDGQEFYFSRHELHDIYVTRYENGAWQPASVTPFSLPDYKDCDPMFSPDGKKLFFISSRPRNGNDIIDDFDIWYTEREGKSWKTPVNVPGVNSDSSEYYVSLADNNNIYFASSRDGGYGSFDIYYSVYADGAYKPPVNLGPAINGLALEHDAYIAPDESFIVYTSNGRPDAIGNGDLYVSIKKNGQWTVARNAGSEINTDWYELTPYVTPDKKYFIFTTSGQVKWLPFSTLERQLK